MKLKMLLFALVALHMFVVIGNTIAFFVLPFYTPWYIALPCMSIIWTLAFLPPKIMECQLTRWENVLRRKMGLPRIHSFIGHYFVRHFE